MSILHVAFLGCSFGLSAGLIMVLLARGGETVRNFVLGLAIAGAIACATGCGGGNAGSTEPQDLSTSDAGDAQATVVPPCLPLSCQMVDGTVWATATVSADETSSLSAHCSGAATCGDVTTDSPVCVVYTTAGGQLLNTYACPISCCQ